MFHEGQQIGSYTLLRKLGKGGFGEVWLAEKRSQFVTKRVAVKLPLDEQVNFDAIRQEAELWEKASGHSNVLPIIDADVIDGQVVIVSEYAEGGSLAGKLKREGRLPLQKAVEMTIGILNGLEFLHSRRIIHRDIKPQNILLQGDTPRLADFGISRAMNTTIVSSTIIGTDAYMAPEAFDGKRSAQTDIWSVGVVLYALLADKLPFPQEHPSEKLFAILTKEFEPLPPEIPQNLQRIVYKALAKQPENRYQTTREMRDELQKVLVGIAHPTLAPTEVLQIPSPKDTLTDVSAIDNSPKIEETEKVTIIIPPPVRQESVQTQFKQVPFTEQKPLPTEVEKVADNTRNLNSKSLPFKTVSSLSTLVKTLIFGIIALLVVAGGVKYLFTPRNTSQPKNASNSSSNALMNIELKFFESVPLTIKVDGKSNFPLGTTKFSAQDSFVIEYSAYQADKFQLIINGKVIKLSKTPPLGGYTSRFEVTKDNLNQVLQSGSNENLVSASNTNSSPSNSPPATEMKIELSAAEPVAFFIHVDGSKEQSVILAPSMLKNFTPQNSFELSYSPEKGKIIQLKINGKSISIPKNGNSMINLRITKDNLSEILQSGRIEQ